MLHMEPVGQSGAESTVMAVVGLPPGEKTCYHWVLSETNVWIYGGDLPLLLGTRSCERLGP